MNASNQYLNFLVEPNRLFLLPFNANDSRMVRWRYYLPTAKVEGYNVMIDGKIIF